MGPARLTRRRSETTAAMTASTRRCLSTRLRSLLKTSRSRTLARKSVRSAIFLNSRGSGASPSAIQRWAASSICFSCQASIWSPYKSLGLTICFMAA